MQNVQGANVSWNLPDPSSGEILEYTVYMALRTAEGQEQSGVTPASKLSFAPIYRGTQPSCLVPTETLASAHIDTSSKPAVIFRIAAKNKLNYGPATQARWILGTEKIDYSIFASVCYLRCICVHCVFC
jgi:host cell factor